MSTDPKDLIHFKGFTAYCNPTSFMSLIELDKDKLPSMFVKTDRELFITVNGAQYTVSIQGINALPIYRLITENGVTFKETRDSHTLRFLRDNGTELVAWPIIKRQYTEGQTTPIPLYQIAEIVDGYFTEHKPVDRDAIYSAFLDRM